MDFSNLAIFEKHSKKVRPLRALEQADMATIKIKDEKLLKQIGNLLVFHVKPFQNSSYENSTHTNVQTNYYDPLKPHINREHATNHQTNISKVRTKVTPPSSF